MIIDYAIRNAESESAIYFLLTAYIETTQFGGRLPEYLTNLPITRLEDVETRSQRFVVELDKASKQLSNESGLVLEEALQIFDAALCRLKVLEREKTPFLASRLSGDNVRNSPRRGHGDDTRGATQGQA